jgi:hypothetical protein
LTFDGGEAEVAFDYKSQSESNVPMRTCCFARLNQLQTGV